MTKEERQKRSEELKARRKEKALERKRAKIEADKVKVQLKREEHKILLEKTHALLWKHTPSAAAGSATDIATSTAQPEPEVARRHIGNIFGRKWRVPKFESVSL